MWYRNIFKLGVCLENTYTWLGLKNNTKRLLLAWLVIIPDTFPRPDGPPLELSGFVEDFWRKRYLNSDPQNVREWASNKLMSGHQYSSDTQYLYNDIVGSIKGYPLTIERLYLNYEHKAIQYILRKYMDADQRLLLPMADK